jgi:hypothetical protein
MDENPNSNMMVAPQTGSTADAAESQKEFSPWKPAAALLVIAFVAWYFFYDDTLLNPRKSSLDTTELSEATRSGDFASALSIQRGLQDDQKASPEDRARALFGSLGAMYRVTRDVDARLTDIRNMQNVIADTNVSSATRALTLSMLAAQFDISGRHPRVFDSVYASSFLSSFLVPDDPDLSNRKLFEYSHSILPTSFASISVAHWYAQSALFVDAESLTEGYKSRAIDNLTAAEQLYDREVYADAAYADSMRALWYSYHRAVIIGHLAMAGVEPYVSDYDSPYRAFIASAERPRHVLVNDFLPFLRLHYAYHLKQNGRLTDSKAQLDALAREVQAADQEISSFVQFLVNEKSYRSDGAYWRIVSDLMEASNDFRTLVTGIVGTL